MKLKQIHCLLNTTCSAIPLEPRKIIKKSINKSLTSIILVIVIFLLLSGYAQSIIETGMSWYNFGWTFAFLGILILFIVGNIIFQLFYFRYYFYDLTPEEIVIMKGVISRNRISIRYEKIQNIFIDQDFLDRIFRLYDVHIATADVQSAMAAHIDGVSKENAEKLKSILDEKIRSRRGESGI